MATFSINEYIEANIVKECMELTEIKVGLLDNNLY